MTTCPASLVIAGEHFPCRTLDYTTTLDGTAPTSHDGWAHSNSDAEAVWQDDPTATESPTFATHANQALGLDS